MTQSFCRTCRVALCHIAIYVSLLLSIVVDNVYALSTSVPDERATPTVRDFVRDVVLVCTSPDTHEDIVAELKQRRYEEADRIRTRSVRDGTCMLLRPLLTGEMPEEFVWRVEIHPLMSSETITVELLRTMAMTIDDELNVNIIIGYFAITRIGYEVGYI